MKRSFVSHLRGLGRPLVPPDPAREELDRGVDLVLELGSHVRDLPECGDVEHVQLLNRLMGHPCSIGTLCDSDGGTSRGILRLLTQAMPLDRSLRLRIAL